jgi:hypothetical protein
MNVVVPDAMTRVLKETAMGLLRQWCGYSSVVPHRMVDIMSQWEADTLRDAYNARGQETCTFLEKNS